MSEQTPERTSEEIKRRNQRNVAIALGLSTFMLIVFVVTILRISVNVGAAP